MTVEETQPIKKNWVRAYVAVSRPLEACSFCSRVDLF